VFGWRKCWYKDKYGTVHRGAYRLAADRLVLRSLSGNYFEGYKDGKTSWDDTVWFPDSETMELSDWMESLD
jgi:hypothetical protein